MSKKIGSIGQPEETEAIVQEAPADPGMDIVRYLKGKNMNTQLVEMFKSIFRGQILKASIWDEKVSAVLNRNA